MTQTRSFKRADPFIIALSISKSQFQGQSICGVVEN